MNHYLPLLVLLLWLSGANLLAQPNEGLPRYLTEEEVALLRTYRPVSGGEVEDSPAPPPFPVRSMAEWEELQALLITWGSYSAIQAEIVRAAREECRVLIACASQTVATNARNYLLSRNVDVTSNVEFVIVPNNSVWVRDYGPNCAYMQVGNEDSLCFIDWRYNRPRPLDDALPSSIAQHFNVPIYQATVPPDDLVHTGGNFMSDGMGTGFSSQLILIENRPGNGFGATPKTEEDIDRIMANYHGLNRYIKMDVLPYDGIHHIDMHMKLLDEETLLVGQYPPGVADGPQIEANLQYVLSHFKSYFGTPYRVVRIPMPPHNGKYPDQGGHYRTYANAVFVNKTLIVPYYEEQYDTVALRLLKEALPGYRIVGVDCNGMIAALGAIHCITKEIGAPHQLRIIHQPLPCMDNTRWPAGYPVWASVHYQLPVDSVRVCYTADTAGPWACVPMRPYLQDDTLWNYVGAIPPQPAGITVYYYIEAVASDGKRMVRPMPAPKGYWSFCVEGSVATRPAPTAVLLNAIYPNPASAITVLPLRAERAVQATVNVYNALGQVVQRLFEGELPAGETNLFLHADRLPSGTYWVAVHTPGQVLTQKLLVR